MAPGSVRGRSYGSGPHGLGEWFLPDPPPLPSQIDLSKVPGKAVEWWNTQSDFVKVTTTVLGGLLAIRVIRGVL